jgi:hypothetical protein
MSTRFFLPFSTSKQYFFITGKQARTHFPLGAMKKSIARAPSSIRWGKVISLMVLCF